MRSLAVVALVVAACTGPEEPVVDCGADLPQIRVTESRDIGVPLEDGDDVTLVHGPQGGWHVEVGVVVVDPEPRVELVLEIEALGEEVVRNEYSFRVNEHDGCTGHREGLFGFLDVSALVDGEANTPPELLVGEELHLTATVVGSQGTAVREVRLLGVPDPKDVEE